MSGVKVVLGRDVRTFFTNFYGVGFRTLVVVLETVIFAFILSNAVPPGAVGSLTYLQFFALGSLVVSIFWASYNIGRDVYWDRESGYLNYLMSLPIPRSEIIVGRTLGGSFRGILTALPLYVLAAIIVPTTALNILESLGVLFVFAIGLCGLGIMVSLSVREETRARLLNTFLSLALIRSSTAIYPVVAMPVWLQVGARLNPVTYASDSIRSVTVYSQGGSLPVFDITIVLTFATLAGAMGSWLFSRMIEGGPTE
jgi:ABC-2 type transport system permease protein